MVAKVHDIDAGLPIEQQIDRVMRRVTNPDGTLNDEAAERERQEVMRRMRTRAMQQQMDRRWLKMLERAFVELKRIDREEGKR